MIRRPLAEPIRIVRNLHKTADYTDDKETAARPFIECVQTIYNINGINSPLTPGRQGRGRTCPTCTAGPGTRSGTENFEKDMKRPDHSEELFNFK